MTSEHGPSDETLLRYVAGSLAVGPSLVVAAHVENCPICRARAAQFERVGGALLADAECAPMRPDAIARAMRACREVEQPAAARESLPPKRADVGMLLPRALDGCAVGSWRWLAPGFCRSWITVPGSPEAKVMLLRGRPGLRLPSHSHAGTEYTLVLKGCLRDDRADLGPGDFDEADTTVNHEPMVGMDVECVCLAALDGGMKLNGWVGRWLQPLYGF
jgi:putative transcriptional regulator